MEFQFKAKEWAQLSVTDRVRRCRLLAEEARLLSERSPPGLKERYLAISEEWLRLAEQIDLCEE